MDRNRNNYRKTIKSFTVAVIMAFCFGCTEKPVSELQLEKNVPALLKKLHDEDVSVRKQAVAAVDSIIYRSTDETLVGPAVQPLIEALQDEEAGVRCRVCEALETIAGKIQDPSVLKKTVSPLRSVLRDNDPIVRGNAARALGDIAAIIKDSSATEAATDTLIPLLEHKLWIVRLNATEALGDIAAKSDNDRIKARIVEGLVGTLKDDDTRVWGGANRSLKTIGTPQALAGLKAHHRTEQLPLDQ